MVASNKAFSDFQVRYADRGRRTAVAEWYQTLVAARSSYEGGSNTFVRGGLPLRDGVIFTGQVMRVGVTHLSGGGLPLRDGVIFVTHLSGGGLPLRDGVFFTHRRY